MNVKNKVKATLDSLIWAFCAMCGKVMGSRMCGNIKRGI